MQGAVIPAVIEQDLEALIEKIRQKLARALATGTNAKLVVNVGKDDVTIVFEEHETCRLRPAGKK